MDARKGKPAEPAAITAMYESLVASLPRLGRLPRVCRFTLGERLQRTQLEVLEALVRARYGREKQAQLEQANVGLEVCRLLVRALCDTKAISPGQYEEWVLELNGVGKQVGGWSKSVLTREAGTRGTDAARCEPSV